MEEEKAFLEKYGFTNFQTVTVLNPTKDDYEFQIMVDVGVDRSTGKLRTDAKKYLVKAGEMERFPGYVANMYLDGMAKKLAQEDPKLGLGAVVNFHTRAKLYDDLIADVDDLLNKQYVPFEEDTATADKVEETKEETFAGARKNASK